LSQGFFTLYLYVSEGHVRTIVLVLWMALAIIIPADLLRFRFKGFARTYENLLGFLMRESERVRHSHLILIMNYPYSGRQNSVNGVVWYILGVNFVLSFYPQDVATVAILMYVLVNSPLPMSYSNHTIPNSQPFLGRYSGFHLRPPLWLCHT
jgi:diacylglycerol kinase (CTP)